MAKFLDEYVNETMVCEGILGMCRHHVARVYHPFCSECLRYGILKGHFKSRTGVYYSYNGHRWVLDPKLNECTTTIT